MNPGLMTCRYEWLTWMMAGYAKTGEPLIGFDGNQLLSFYCLDDIGIYYLIPKLAHSLSLSLNQAIYLFFYGAMASACLLGFLGFFLLFKTPLTRLVSLAGLLAVSYIARMPDTYVAYCATTVAVVPLTLWFVKQQKYSLGLLIWAFFAGVLIGGAHFVRSFAGMPMLVFVACSVLLGMRIKKTYKAVVLSTLIIGCSVPVVFFNALYNHYTCYVATAMPEQPINLNRHVLWHALYLGLGFLNNDFGIKYDDSLALAKARSIKPDVVYGSQDYENILRNETLRIARENPDFIIKTLFAKCGILLFFLLKFANFGLIIAWFVRKEWWLELSFLAALAASSLFGLLTMPFSVYLFGFNSLAILYSVLSINYALEQFNFAKNFARLRFRLTVQ